MPMELFTPYGTDTTAVSVSGTTASGALNLPSSVPSSVRVYNSTAVTVFIQFGISTVTATTAKMPIPAGAVEVFEIGTGVTHIAGITAGTTGTLYATTGRGG